MEERRGSLRRKPEVELSVRVRALLPARVLDISPAGMQLELSSLLRVGIPCEVKTKLGGEELKWFGTVKWCRADRFGTNEQGEKVLLYKAGLEIDQVNEEVWQRLTRAVETEERVEAGVEVAKGDVLTPEQEANPEAPLRQGPIKVKINTSSWSPGGEKKS